MAWIEEQSFPAATLISIIGRFCQPWSK